MERNLRKHTFINKMFDDHIYSLDDIYDFDHMYDDHTASMYDLKSENSSKLPPDPFFSQMLLFVFFICVVVMFFS